jgi:exopolyphosphatase/guanosine-5'-triphosphate,3'-diphosphate pyrophosphatase
MKNKTLLRGLNEKQRSELESVLSVAKKCNYEPKHTKQVTRLALELFDGLGNLHRLGSHERYYLLCAALLHDIGVHTEGPKAHHKTALNIILKTPILQFSQKDRLLVGSIARYHRRALPSKKHDHFKALKSEEREMVSILAGILRVADGLDYSHKRRIRHVQATFSDKKIKLLCFVNKFPVKKEIQSAKRKSDLLSQTFQREVVLKTTPVEDFMA